METWHKAQILKMEECKTPSIWQYVDFFVILNWPAVILASSGGQVLELKKKGGGGKLARPSSCPLLI